MKSTQAMRDRIRELMSRDQDDYDRAVECVLDDLEAALRASNQPTEAMIEAAYTRYGSDDIVKSDDWMADVLRAALAASPPSPQETRRGVFIPPEPTRAVLDALSVACRETWGVNVKQVSKAPFYTSEWRERMKPIYRALFDAALSTSPAPAEALRPYPELLDLRASLKAMLALFDDEGNMIATFEELQNALNGGFDTLTRTKPSYEITSPVEPAAPAEDVWRSPATWRAPIKTVADLVSNLLTLDQSMEIHGAYHANNQARARGLSLSRERVTNGIIRVGDESVPYSLIIWSGSPAEYLRASVIEECAKVAEDQALAWINGEASTAIGHSYQSACRTVANRIRSLTIPDPKQAMRGTGMTRLDCGVAT